MSKKQFKIKKTESALANNVSFYLPLIEEITKADMMPMCVIGIKQHPDNEKNVSAYFATHNEMMDAMLYDICKAFIKNYDAGTINQI